jgi:hypothetical protein
LCAMRLSPNGFWLSVYIAKVIEIFDHRVASPPRLAFEGLELCDGKLSRTVLRGLGAGNSPRLPGIRQFLCDLISDRPMIPKLYVILFPGFVVEG